MVQAAGHYELYTTEQGWVIVSGQTGEDGDRLAPDLSAQTAQAIRNIATILEGVGASLEDVKKTTCFLANIDDFAEFNAAYARGMGMAKPARTTVGVAGLPDGALVEIEAWAFLRQ